MATRWPCCRHCDCDPLEGHEEPCPYCYPDDREAPYEVEDDGS